MQNGDDGLASLSRSHVAPGTRLNGIYEIESLIAAGGMGEVYKGHAIQTGDPVAIKMIRPELAQNAAALALFRKEASALHDLYHEAVVRYYVFSIDPVLGCPYLAMEYVDGPSLSDLLKRGALPFDSVRLLQQRLASALQEAHERGIVHRDVSSDNVILPGGNVRRAKIIDFGIARTTRLGDGTVIGAGFAGKYNYVSPEQLGLFGGDVTPKSDIYSLGLVLAEAATGKPLDMGGSQAEVIEKRRKVPDLAGVDARLRPLLAGMLQPKPDDRPESMAAVAAWQPGVSARPSGGRKTRFGLVAGGVAATATLGVVLAVLVGPQLAALWSSQRPAVAPGANVPSLPTNVEPLPPLPPNPTPPPPPPAPPTPAPLPPVPTPVIPGPTPRGDPSNVTPAPGPPRGRVERVAEFTAGYGGGECFYIAPLLVSEQATIFEGFGTSTAPFARFDEAFKQTQGYEAQIAVRLVTPAQCPAVEFLGRSGTERATAPRLQLGAFVLKSGDSLSGTVEPPGAQPVELLLVSDEGFVHSLAPFTQRAGDKVSFNLRILESSTRPFKPQMVLAVASARPLTMLTTDKPMAADRIFPLLSQEAASTGRPLSVMVKYFELKE